MNLEEYKSWLDRNKNLEEAQAYNVASMLIDFHLPACDFSEVQLYPRKVIHFKKGRLEFDLLIHLYWENGDKSYERLIGVEFKEVDINKVVEQAVIRREFVDYMYIATRNVLASEENMLLLSYYRIGWVLWFDDGFVKMLFPSKLERRSNNLILEMIKYNVNKMLEDKLDEKVDKLIEEKLSGKVQLTLTSF